MNVVCSRMAVGAIALVTLVGVSSGHAAQFQATELTYDNALFGQFNLINLGNYTASANETIQGRALVGGNVQLSAGSTLTVGCSGSTAACGGNSTLPVTANPSSTFTSVGANTASTNSGTGYGYGALTVFGNVSNQISGASSAASSIKTVGTGDVNIGGSISLNNTSNTSQTGTISMNGGTAGGGINVAGSVAAGSVIPTGQSEIRATAMANGGTSTGTIQVTDTIYQVFSPFANFQTGASTVTNTAAIAGFNTPARALYSGLANLPGSPNVKADALAPPPTGNGSIFTATADYTGSNGLTYGVVTTSLANLAAQKSGFGIANGSGNTATFVIVNGTYDGTAATLLPSLSGTGQNVIYDFVGASSLKLGDGNTFNGSILAPLASLTEGTTGGINGTVIVSAMNQTTNLYSGAAFTGDLSGLTNFQYNPRVPEPASLSLLGFGAAAAAYARFHRRK